MEADHPEKKREEVVGVIRPFANAIGFVSLEHIPEDTDSDFPICRVFQYGPQLGPEELKPFWKKQVVITIEGDDPGRECAVIDPYRITDIRYVPDNINKLKRVPLLQRLFKSLGIIRTHGAKTA